MNTSYANYILTLLRNRIQDIKKGSQINPTCFLETYRQKVFFSIVVLLFNNLGNTVNEKKNITVSLLKHGTVPHMQLTTQSKGHKE